MQRLKRETEAGRFIKRRTVWGEPREREGDGENETEVGRGQLPQLPCGSCRPGLYPEGKGE